MSESTPVWHLPAHELQSIVRSHLAQLRSENEIRRWFDPLEFTVHTQPYRLCIGFPHSFFHEPFAEYFQRDFEHAVTASLGSTAALCYDCPSLETTPQNRSVALVTSPLPGGSNGGTAYSFDNFLTNKKNYFPYASAREVIAAPGRKYNPFVVSGDSGTGKTHLLKAMGQSLRENSTGHKALYLTIDDLHTFYKEAGGDMARSKLLASNLLLIDDLQSLQAYTYLQNELLLVFNTLYEQNRQLAFACRGKLPECGFLDPTLLSRLEWGLMVHLKPPDLELRVQYLQKTNHQQQLGLSRRHILLLGQYFKDFRYLHGVLTKLGAYKELISPELNDEALFQIIGSLDSSKPIGVSPDHIFEIVATHFNISVEDLRGNSRMRAITSPRQIAMALCRSELGLSYPQIGRLFGGRDHTTIMHGIKKIHKLQKDKHEMNTLINTLKQQCHTLASQDP
ncbi:MAG: DnaA ATPase domain-containing protein [Thermodesulfobacteriota bacterium]